MAVEHDPSNGRPRARRTGRSRVMPHHSEMEAAILGAVVRDNEVLGALPHLEVHQFYDFKHRVVFEAMRNLQAAGRSITVVMLEHEIENTGRLEAIGGVAFLGTLALSGGTLDNVVEYAGIVTEAARQRDFILELGSALERAQDWPHEPGEMVDELLGRLGRFARAPVDQSWDAATALALAEVRARLDAAGQGKTGPLFSMDATDLLRIEFPEARWLVHGLITRGGIAMIGAEPKAAKTWLGTEIAIAVATGSKVCGEFFAEAGTVAYFYAEDMGPQIRNRTRALLDGANRLIAPGRLRMEPRGRFLDILNDRDLAWIVASCRKLGRIDLLVLDPLRDLHSGEEDKSDSMRDVMRRLRALGELLDCTVAVVHHASKFSKDTARRRPGQNLRGSGAIHGSIDSGIYLEETDGDETSVFSNIVVSQVKGARSAGRFKLELTVSDNDAGEAIKATWAVERDIPKQGTPAAATRRDLEDDRAVMTWLRKLATAGAFYPKTTLRELAQNDHRLPPGLRSEGRPVPEKRLARSIDRLMNAEQLRAVDNKVLIVEATQGDR